MIVHISQPRIYPHLSYLEKIDAADLFVVMDDLVLKPELYERRNRYYNPMSGDARFLTIPTEKGKIFSETKILDLDFAAKHRRILRDCYRKHSRFYCDSMLEYLVCDPDTEWFMDYFFKSMEQIGKVLNITTPIKLASEVPGHSKKVQRLNDILSFYNADEYLSGAAGAGYMNGDCIVPVTFRDHQKEVEVFHTNPNTDDMLMFVDTIFNSGIEKTRELLCYARN